MRSQYFFLLALSLFFAAACRPAAAPLSVGEKPVSINDVPTTNQPLPPLKPIEEMQWTKFDGETGAELGLDKLKNLRGKVVVLDFWATYCPPCLEEIPHLRELQKKYGADNLAIIGLHVGGEDDFKQVPAFAARLKIDYTLATPEEELTRFIFGAESAIPQTAVFDRDGKLVKKIVGFSGKIKTDLDSAVEQIINQNR